MNTEWKKFNTSKGYSVFSIALENAYFLQVFMSITISLDYHCHMMAHTPGLSWRADLLPSSLKSVTMNNREAKARSRVTDGREIKQQISAALFVLASSCPKHMEILCTFENCELLTCVSGETVNHLCTGNTLRLFCCDFLFLGFPLS